MKAPEIFRTLELIADDVIPVGNAKIAAAFVLDGRIISIGVNQMKTDPLQARFAKNEHAIYLHAEIAALKKALRRLSREDIARCEVYVLRRSRVKGKLVNAIAKPCVGCQRALDNYNIKNVFWSE